MSTTAPAASKIMWLSVAAALSTIAIKTVAAAISGSVGLFSDALESLVNLVAAAVTLMAVRWSEAPADDEHPFGHARGELLAALLEGTLVMLAGVAILITAVERLLHPIPLGQTTIGLIFSGVAAVINLVVGIMLIRNGRKNRVSAIEADGHHLLTDVWSTVAVFIGVILVQITGKLWFDAGAAIAMSGLVLYTAVKIVVKSVNGLIDHSATPEEGRLIREIIVPFAQMGVLVTQTRTRRSGRQVFIHLTLAVPSQWTVFHAHEMADKIEHAIEAAIESSTVETHVEPSVK